MFERALDRAAALASPERTIALIGRGQLREAAWQLTGRAIAKVLLQPVKRDTAGGIFLALAYVRSRDPEATVILFPSDHFAFREERFRAAVRGVASAAAKLPDRLVVLGVPPDRDESNHGWILTGNELARIRGRRVFEVQAFVPTPTAAEARAARESGGVWDTMVLAAKVETLWLLGWQCFPAIMPLFEELSTAVGSGSEEVTLEAAYRALPAGDFSSQLLNRVPEWVAVVRLSGVLWSDWGRADRVALTLDTAQAGVRECG